MVVLIDEGRVLVAYSLDLRQRVVDAAKEREQSKEEIAERFLVSVPTINRWLRREHLKADKPGPTTSHTINREQLRELVSKEPDCYLDEYAEKLGSKRSTVAYNLKVMQITRKKNHAIRGKK
jgi:putative transposase